MIPTKKNTLVGYFIVRRNMFYRIGSCYYFETFCFPIRIALLFLAVYTVHATGLSNVTAVKAGQASTATKVNG
jgi:hypothetical protein